MPDQAIIRSQTEGHMARQEAAGAAMQHTLAQLREMRDLPGIVVAELDATYQQLTAYLEKGGRSAPHQRFLEERTARLLALHEGAVDHVARRTYQDIIDNRPKEVAVTRIIEVPKQGVIPPLFGR
jgi:hypothetical protein